MGGVQPCFGTRVLLLQALALVFCMGKLQPEHEFWTNAHDNRGRTTSRRTWQTAGVADKSALEKTVRTSRMEAARAAGIELAQLKSREELLQETLGYVKGKEGGFGAGLNEKYTPSMVISGEAAQRELKFHPTQMNREASRRQTAMYLGRDLPPEGYALRAKRVRERFEEKTRRQIGSNSDNGGLFGSGSQARFSSEPMLTPDAINSLRKKRTKVPDLRHNANEEHHDEIMRETIARTDAEVYAAVIAKAPPLRTVIPRLSPMPLHSPYAMSPMSLCLPYAMSGTLFHVRYV